MPDSWRPASSFERRVLTIRCLLLAVLMVAALASCAAPTIMPTDTPSPVATPSPIPSPIVLAPSPTPAEEPTATATATPTLEPMATATKTPIPEPAETTTSSPTPQRGQPIPAPNGQWIALLNKTAGSLDVQTPDGEIIPIFPPGSTVDAVEWAPDSGHLLVVRAHWQHAPSGCELQVDGPLEIWQVRLEDKQVESPRLVFQSPTPPDETGAFTPEQVVFGACSPNGRYRLFWHGMLSASALADGLSLRVLDVETGEVTFLARATLLNSRYQSWTPDSSALAFTAGGYRSAQVNKWLNLFDAISGQITTVVSKTEQIPGIVAWSPRGDLIAYAAVPADQTSPDWADWMVFENPAIAGRRVYLLDPATGRHWRLNDTDTFQDASTWSDDGEVLYYVQREGDTMVLMAADPATGQAQVVEGSRWPAPGAVGYYGQSEWDYLLAYRPEAPRATVPPLTETYTDTTSGFTLRHPVDWHVGQGWQGVYGWQEALTLSSYPPDAPAPDLAPFSGQALIASRVLEVPEGRLDALLQKVLAMPDPGQILDKDGVLTAFEQRELSVEGQPATRLETMGDFGVVNHVLVVLLDGTRGLVLRGRGDGRVFDAVVGSLQLR